LSTSFLSTLGEGRHTFELQFKGGVVAGSYFNVRSSSGTATSDPFSGIVYPGAIAVAILVVAGFTIRKLYK
jgi:hypothetical protein